MPKSSSRFVVLVLLQAAVHAQAQSRSCLPPIPAREMASTASIEAFTSQPFHRTSVTANLSALSSVPSVGGDRACEPKMLLPDAPQPQLASGNSEEQASSHEAAASVSGTIVDPTGAVIAGAKIRLTQPNGETLAEVLSGTNGEFRFTNLMPGSYILIITDQSFVAFTSPEFVLASLQSYASPAITLEVAGTSTELTVRPSEIVAAEQIRQQEKQRVFGIIPDFYTSYVPDAAPMSSGQKFSLAAHDTFDWTTLLGYSVVAGMEQASGTYKGYGQGAAGYGKRWGAQLGDGLSLDLLSHAVFPSLFHQDPRYFYQGTGTTKSRLYHALSSAFVARSDSGKSMPNYSYVLGAMSSGALSNAYYPHADRGVSLVFTTAAIGIAGRIGQAVAQEFFGKKVTKNVP